MGAWELWLEETYLAPEERQVLSRKSSSVTCSQTLIFGALYSIVKANAYPSPFKRTHH